MVKSIRAALGIATVLAAFQPAFGRPPRCPDNIIVQFYADGILQQTFTLDPTDFAYLFFPGTSMAVWRHRYALHLPRSTIVCQPVGSASAHAGCF